MLQKKIKCEICRDYRADRFCIRKAKNICWHCCNDMRTDGKCPEDCKFVPYIKNKTQHIKVYSKTELLDYFSKWADHWFITPNELWEGKSPLELLDTKEGKKKIELFFQEQKIPLLSVAKIYKQKYNIDSIDLSEYPNDKESYEDIAKKFMDALILRDNKLIQSFMKNKIYQKDENYFEKFLKRLYSNKQIKRLKKYDILTASATKDKKNGLVTFELNKKFDFSVYLFNTEEGWKVNDVFFATEQEFVSLVNLLKTVANLLSKQNMAEAYKYLSSLKRIFFNNPQIYYLFAVYYELNHNLLFAIENLEIACEIEPDFIPYHEKLSELYIRKEEFQKAEKVLRYILRKNNNNLMALNNLAILYIHDNLYEEAKALYKRCLEIDPNFTVAKENLEKLKKTIPQNPSS